MRLVRGRSGFTLIEVMVVVAIVAILAVIAYPSFLGQITKARRSEASEMISRILVAQEKYVNILQCTSYAQSIVLPWPTTLPTHCSDGTHGLGIAAATGARYDYALSAVTGAASYTVTATAKAGTSQASDANCTTLTAAVSFGTPTLSPANCWSR